MNTQLTDNEALELKALIAPSYPELEKIADLEEVKKYLLNFEAKYQGDDHSQKRVKFLNLT
ncbi:MAG: hypothetical protein J6U05_00500, partial [Neisseriaceae bacterium]|nr:hypothetical protein [Neisseriaceae bacterium]